MHRWLELVLIALLASTVARANPKTCPADFKLAAAGGKCAIGDKLPPPCTYPEGHCACVVPALCSGIPRPPPPISDAVWLCTPKVRPDGCPGDQPAVGTTCDAKKLPDDGCWYGNCAGTKLSCVAGTWKVTGSHGPPPSARPSHPASLPGAAHGST